MNGLIKRKMNSFRIILSYYLCILLLSLYATYKNGYLLYRKELISFGNIFKLIILIILTLIITYLIDYYFKRKEYNIKSLIKIDYNPIYNCLILLTLPININTIYYLIILFIFNILNNIINIKNINIYIIYRFIIILLLIILGNYSYSNIYELNIDTSLNFFDMFMGRSIGCIGTTNHFMIIISFLILLTTKSFKKEIPLTSLITYIICIIISILFKFNIFNNLDMLLNSTYLFGITFIATIPNFSPVSIKGKIIYGISVGLFSFILNHLINPFEGVFISIIIANILIIFYNKLGKKLIKKEAL